MAKVNRIMATRCFFLSKKNSILILTLGSLITFGFFKLPVSMTNQRTVNLNNHRINNSVLVLNSNELSQVTRDFFRYTCQNRKRVGGLASRIRNTNDSLFRIDGAWFICLDGGLAPQKGRCSIFSFGVNHDFSFDQAMNNDFGCRVFSFDPFVEDQFFEKIRSSNPNFADSHRIQVNTKWTFYR